MAAAPRKRRGRLSNVAGLSAGGFSPCAANRSSQDRGAGLASARRGDRAGRSAHPLLPGGRGGSCPPATPRRSNDSASPPGRHLCALFDHGDGQEGEKTSSRPRLVLLCHKFRCLLRAAQHGQRESVVARAATNLRRIVAIEFGTWRSGRNGGSSGLVTFA